MNLTGADFPYVGLYGSASDAVVFSELWPLIDYLTITNTVVFTETYLSTWVRIVAVTDSFNMTGEGTYGTLFHLEITDSVDISTVQNAVRLVTAGIAEALMFSQNVPTKLTGTPIIIENLNIIDGSVRSGNIYIAWVMNADNNAVTRYEDWGVNAGAKFKGKYIGSGIDGVYELEGASDDGVQIDASVSLPRTDFGVSQKKGVQYAYVSARGDGNLVLNVAADDGTRYEYPCVVRSETEIVNARAVLGKGLKGRYFQLDIANVDGADFEIDTVELTPIPVKRRL
jgi:hypothetical protein